MREAKIGSWNTRQHATRLGKSTDLEGRYVTRGFQKDEFEVGDQE